MIRAYPLFKGMTRPTMIAGVTLEALVINALLTSILFVGSGSFLCALICVPIHAICVLICLKDPRQFELISRWMATKARCVNRKYWTGSTVSPLPFRKP